MRLFWKFSIPVDKVPLGNKKGWGKKDKKPNTRIALHLSSQIRFL